MSNGHDLSYGSVPHSRNSGKTLWFTGLSGAGKSTIAKSLYEHLVNKNKPCYILDGDNIRNGLCSDLGFSEIDRYENIRRIAEVATMLNDAGIIVLVATISPYKRNRDLARMLHEDRGLAFKEVYVATSLETCEARDVKGLYKKARSGEITNFTGVSDPYEVPQSPDITIEEEPLAVSVARLLV